MKLSKGFLISVFGVHALVCALHYRSFAILGVMIGRPCGMSVMLFSLSCAMVFTANVTTCLL